MEKCEALELNLKNINRLSNFVKIERTQNKRAGFDISHIRLTLRRAVGLKAFSVLNVVLVRSDDILKKRPYESQKQGGARAWKTLKHGLKWFFLFLRRGAIVGDLEVRKCHQH